MASSTQQAEQRRLRVVAFVDGCLRGLSNKDSAIAAGFSPKTAAASGSRMAKSADVLDEIQRRGAMMAESSRLLDPTGNMAAESLVNADSSVGEIAEIKKGLSDHELEAASVKWVDGTSFLLAVVNAPRAALKIRVDAAFKLERIKAGFGGGKDRSPGLFDSVPTSADAWASQGGSRAH